MKTITGKLIDALNAFDIDAALKLFTPDAVIDDDSIGDIFHGEARVRAYFDKYFVAYNTVTRVLSIEASDERQARAHVDFKGGFGHETGVLQITTNADGLIVKIDASLD